MKLTSKIASKELVLSGTVAKRYKRCGKPNCRCQKDDQKYWHGPYWIWTQKIDGKTKTKTLSSDQAKAVKKGISEMGEIRILIGKWKELSLSEIEKL